MSKHPSHNATTPPSLPLISCLRSSINVSLLIDLDNNSVPYTDETISVGILYDSPDSINLFLSFGNTATVELTIPVSINSRF